MKALLDTMGQSDVLAHSVLAQMSADNTCYFVCSPGGRNAPFSFALGARPNTDSTVILDERMAAFFALGRARSRPDELVVLICTSGSAGAHYLPALIEADYSGVPLFIITSDRPNHLRDTGAAQTIEQRNFFGHHVVASDHVDVHDTPTDEVGAIVNALIDVAMHQQGPVHLNVGFDEPLHDASLSTPIIEPRHSPKTSQVGADDIATMIETLDQAKSGLIIWGPNACTTSADQEAAAVLMSRLPWPAFAHGASNLRGCTASGLVPYAFDHGVFTRLVHEPRPECILYIGQAPTSRVTLGYLSSATSAQVISVTKGRHVVRPWKHGSAYTGQSPAMLAQIANGLRERDPIDSTKYDPIRREFGSVLSTCDGPHRWSASMIRSLLKQLPDNAQLHVGNSLVIRDLDLYCGASKSSISILANRGVNGIDGQIATAAGMASTAPDRANVLLCGDLTALHDSGSLLLAKRFGLTICVVDNDGGAIFDHLPFAENTDVFDRFFTTPQAVTLSDIAKAYELDVHVISETSDLPDIHFGQAGLYVFKVNANIGKAERKALAARMEAMSC